MDQAWAAEVLIRLAWEIDRSGSRRSRDSILTLAVLEAGDGPEWSGLVRERLVADRPEHFLSRHLTVAEALDHPKIVEHRDRLRVKHPIDRAEWRLLGFRAARGPYLGRDESIGPMVEDLVSNPSVRLERKTAGD